MRALILALVIGCGVMTAQAPMSGRSLNFHVSGLGGYELDGSARGVVGLDYSAGASVTMMAGVPVLHRIILDRSHNLYFGYDLVVSNAPGAGKLRLHFAPLSDLSGFPRGFCDVPSCNVADSRRPHGDRG